MNKRTTYFALIGILALATVLRFTALDRIPPGIYPDEAMNGTNGLDAWESGNWKVFYPDNNGREGLFMNIVGISLKLFGIGRFGMSFPSALFGVLTVLGVFLLVKELFAKKDPRANARDFANDESRMTNYGQVRADQKIDSSDDDVSNGYRLNVFGNWTLDIGNYHADALALLASFFVATSYWHLNFSRMSFRAIMVPFILTWSFYLLVKAMRSAHSLPVSRYALLAIGGGALFGLGFHTYIAFRIAPLLLFVFLFLEYIRSRRLAPSLVPSPHLRSSDTSLPAGGGSTSHKLKIVSIFLVAAFIVALPMGLYFVQHRNDFLKREGSKIGVFEQARPLAALAKSVGLTALQFNFRGDCNWRHNLPCRPQLGWIASPFFLIGLFFAGRKIWRDTLLAHAELFLIAWIGIMILPEILTAEGIPHALRAIGIIPAVYAISALGIVHAASWAYGRFAPRKALVTLIFALTLAAACGITAYDYFFVWAKKPTTAGEFTNQYGDIAQYISSLPPNASVYVVVNAGDVLVDGVTVHAQPIKLVLRGVPNAPRVTYVNPATLIASLSNAPPYSLVIPLKDGESFSTSLAAMGISAQKESRATFAAYVIQ